MSREPSAHSAARSIQPHNLTNQRWNMCSFLLLCVLLVQLPWLVSDGRVPTEEVVYSGVCGSTVLLRCGLPSGNDAVPTSWLRDGAEVLLSAQNVHLLPNGDLLIYRHDNYSHTYTCLTEFQSSNGSWVNVTLSQHTLHTHTTLTPSTSVQLANHRAVLHSGENSTLICTYNRLQRSCDLTATPRWSHNGREINSTEPLYSGHVLQLEEVGVVNSGEYCCEVEGEESCTTIHVIETKNVRPVAQFIDPLHTSTLHLSSPLHTSPHPHTHPRLHWLHNGRQLHVDNNQTSLNLTSNLTSDLYGIYQSFVEGGDGTLTQLSLVRVMPRGWTNPPSRPSVTEVPRADIDLLSEIALRVSWTPPLYTGGLDRLLFSVHRSGRVELGPVSGGSGVVVVPQSFSAYRFKVCVVSGEGAVLSELSEVESVAVEIQCYDALSPPSLDLSCDRGRVALTTHTPGAYIYRTGGCMTGNETISVPLGSLASLESVAVGTECAFEGAAARYPECSEGYDCHCFNRYNLEYSQPFSCNVTGLVQFSQSEYSVNESASSVEVCVTAQGYDFSIVMTTTAATATSSSDFTPLWVELSFTEDVLTHCVDVSLTDDVWVEGDEQFSITMTTEHPLVNIPSPTAVVTVLDNDYLNITMETPAVVSEGGSVLVCVGVEGELRREVTLRIDTVNGTAVEGTDFVNLHTEVILSQHNTSSCVSIVTIDDGVVEGGEMFRVVVSSENKSVRSDEWREIRVMDDDFVGVAFHGNSTLMLPINITTFNVCASIDGELARDVNVTLATSEADGGHVLSELVFSPSTVTVCVNLTSNFTDEQLLLVLLTSDPQVHVRGGGLTILEPGLDGPTILNITMETPAVVSEGESVLVCVGVEGKLRREVTLRIDTVNGTAVEGTDFAGLHVEVIILNQHNTSSCVSIVTIDDGVVEGGEVFRVVVSSEDESVRSDEWREIRVMDDDFVGVAFHDNSTLTLPITTFDVCASIEGELARDITVTLATSEADGGRVLSELVFSPSTVMVCVNLTRNLTDEQLLLVLLTSDPQVRVRGGGLTIMAPNQDEPTSEPSSGANLELILSVLVVVVALLIFAICLLILSLCVRRQYLHKRYEWHLRVGLKQSEAIISDWEDPVSVGPNLPAPLPDEVTLYDEFYATTPHQVSAHSLDRNGFGTLKPPCGVTSEEIFEHLQQFSDHHQQDSGIGEYSGVRLGGDSGSFFSGQSFSSYVHCGQYNCVCAVCMATREGKSLALGKSPLARDPESPPQLIGISSSVSLPELNRSHDNHVIPPVTSSLSSEEL